MTIKKYRSVEEMPPAWRESGDPENLQLVVMMMNFFLNTHERAEPGVRKYRSLEDLQRDDPAPYRAPDQS